MIFAAEARKFAQVLQFTWPGCPLIYYGDELGLEGADDPHNRAPMPWGQVPWCFFLGMWEGKTPDGEVCLKRSIEMTREDMLKVLVDTLP